MGLQRTQRLFTWKVSGSIDYTRAAWMPFEVTVVARDFDSAAYLARHHMRQDDPEFEVMIIDIDSCVRLGEAYGWEP